MEVSVIIINKKFAYNNNIIVHKESHFDFLYCVKRDKMDIFKISYAVIHYLELLINNRKENYERQTKKDNDDFYIDSYIDGFCVIV